MQSNLLCLWVSNWKQPAPRDQPLFSAQHLRTVHLLLLCHLQDWGGLSCQGVNWHKNCHRKRWFLAAGCRDMLWDFPMSSLERYFNQMWTVMGAAVSLCWYDCQMPFLPPLATNDLSLWCLKRSCRMFAPCTHVTSASPVPLFMQVAPSSPPPFPQSLCHPSTINSALNIWNNKLKIFIFTCLGFFNLFRASLCFFPQYMYDRSHTSPHRSSAQPSSASQEKDIGTILTGCPDSSWRWSSSSVYTSPPVISSMRKELTLISDLHLRHSTCNQEYYFAHASPKNFLGWLLMLSRIEGWGFSSWFLMTR